MRTLGVVMSAAVLIAVAGCPSQKHEGANHGHAEAEAGHSHERDKMLMADVGNYHVLLTAHLAKAGNELDIFFESQDEPEPVAVELESFTLEAQTADGEKHELVFNPAPAEERPVGEKPGTCSHFVADATWMKPTDTLEIAGKIKLKGKNVVARWSDFNPKKYAHHEE